MAINKSEQTLEDRLINDIDNLKRQLLTFKTHPQPVGADILQVEYTATTNAFALGVPAGSSVTVTITITPLSDFVLTLSTHMFTLYVDGYDAAHAYPNGASLTSAMRKLKLESWVDYNGSKLVSPFGRAFIINVRNDDVSAHDYHFDHAILTPTLTTTSATA